MYINERKLSGKCVHPNQSLRIEQNFPAACRSNQVNSPNGTELRIEPPIEQNASCISSVPVYQRSTTSPGRVQRSAYSEVEYIQLGKSKFVRLPLLLVLAARRFDSITDRNQQTTTIETSHISGIHHQIQAAESSRQRKLRSRTALLNVMRQKTTARSEEGRYYQCRRVLDEGRSALPNPLMTFARESPDKPFLPGPGLRSVVEAVRGRSCRHCMVMSIMRER